VLRDIRGLLDFDDTPSSYFVATTYVQDQNGQTYPAFNMTRDGFTLLAMGYGGPKAHHFKVSYIEAFYAMERTLRQSPVAIPTKPKLSGSLVRETRKLLEHAETPPNRHSPPRCSVRLGSICPSRW
jgi:Rha family phage regulatory protein